MEEKKSGIVWVLVAIIIILLGVILYLGRDKIFNKNITPQPEQNSGRVEPPRNDEQIKQDTPKTEANVVTITNLEDVKAYYAIISPIKDITVYQTKKITSDNLNAEFMILNAIKYENQTDKSEMATVNADNIKKYAEVLYGKTIGSLPKTITQLNSGLTADYTLKNGEYILNDVYDEKYSYGLPALDVVLFQKLEKTNEYIYLYDAVILNAEIWENGCGYISKPDNSGKISLGEGDTCRWKLEDLYKQYPEYFTKYKHTFKGTDYNVTYISSEPIK